MTWATSVPTNFSLPRPLCSRLRPDVRERQTSDRQTPDVRQMHRLMPPPIRSGGIIKEVERPSLTSLTLSFKGSDVLTEVVLLLAHGSIEKKSKLKDIDETTESKNVKPRQSDSRDSLG